MIDQRFLMKKNCKNILLGIFTLCVLVGLVQIYKDLPDGISIEGAPHEVSVDDITFLSDVTYLDEDGVRVSEQEIFPEIYTMIEEANAYILIDMFLFNDMLGASTESYKSLSSELTQKLVEKKRSTPEIEITFITDPINTVYGGDTSAHITQMQQAGIRVIMTDLTKLRDSNPLYSAPWRVFGQWWGNSTDGGWLPHVMDARREKLTLRTYLRLFNFKANHRKVVMSDYRKKGGSGYGVLVTSANPHDGSSAHSNVALRIDTALWQDAYLSEQVVADFSGEFVPAPPILENMDTRELSESEQRATVRLLTEGKIKDDLLREINMSTASEEIDMMMFYLSDRDIVKALKEAASRGVKIRMILDPNKDAFGREKNGIPNRQIAHEIAQHSENANIRWCNTHGEQCHSKITLFKRGLSTTVVMGSANLTRRNIGDYNLETNVIVQSPTQSQVIDEATAFFDTHWENQDGREYTLDYNAYSDDNKLRIILYRFMEATGLSSF